MKNNFGMFSTRFIKCSLVGLYDSEKHLLKIEKTFYEKFAEHF